MATEYCYPKLIYPAINRRGGAMSEYAERRRDVLKRLQLRLRDQDDNPMKTEEAWRLGRRDGRNQDSDTLYDVASCISRI